MIVSRGDWGESVGVKKSVMTVCFCVEGVVGVGGVSRLCCFFFADGVPRDFFLGLQSTISSSELSLFLHCWKSFLEGKRRKSGRSLYALETKGSVSHGAGLSSNPSLG